MTGTRLPKSLRVAQKPTLNWPRLVIIKWRGVLCDDRYAAYETTRLIQILFNQPSLPPIFQNNSMSSDLRARVVVDAWTNSTNTGHAHGFSNSLRSPNLQCPIPVPKFDAAYAKTYKELCINPDCERYWPMPVGNPKALLQRLIENDICIKILDDRPTEILSHDLALFGVDATMSGISYRGNIKNKTDALHYALKEFDVPPEEAVYVCDTAEDVDSANSAHIRAIAITSGYHSKEQLERHKPTLLTSDFATLVDFFSQ